MKSNERFSLARLFLFIIIIAFLSGISCKSSSVEKYPNPTNLTIGTFSKALGNTPYYISRYHKWFETHPDLKGTKISYQEYNDRPTIAGALSKGELQFLFCAEIPAILIRAQGENIRIVELSTIATQEILVPINSKVTEVSQLKGAKVAVLAGTSSHYGMLRILKLAGLAESDVDVRFMNVNEAKTAFEAGRLDAWAVWAPWVEQIEVPGLGRTLPGGGAVINSVGSMPEEFINKHETAARALVECIRRAKEWMINNENEAQEIASKELNLELGVVKRAWPKFKWGASLDEKVIEDIQDKAAFLANMDKTRKSRIIDVRSELIEKRFQKAK